MEDEDWASSSGGASDSEIYLQDANDEEEHYCTSGSISKLQFREDASKAVWNDEMGMAEVVENKGKMWTTTGIVRNSKTYCSIEEIFGCPPSKPEIEDLERQCSDTPFKFCHVAHGRVSFFSFSRVELPIMP